MRNGRLSQSPGAGSYTIPSRLVEGPSFPIGAKLKDGSASALLKNPGPGQYDTQNRDNANMKSGQKYGMGTS